MHAVRTFFLFFARLILVYFLDYSLFLSASKTWYIPLNIRMHGALICIYMSNITRRRDNEKSASKRAWHVNGLRARVCMHSGNIYKKRQSTESDRLLHAQVSAATAAQLFCYSNNFSDGTWTSLTVLLMCAVCVVKDQEIDTRFPFIRVYSGHWVNRNSSEFPRYRARVCVCIVLSLCIVLRYAWILGACFNWWHTPLCVRARSKTLAFDGNIHYSSCNGFAK